MAERLPPSDLARRVPRYALKTVANSAPEFANMEQDVIRQSFSTGNHTWMKEALPVELGPDTVNLLRRQRMERNRLAEPVPQPFSKMTQLWGGGYYQEFEYIPDEYGRRVDYDASVRQSAVDKREKISNHDWRHASQEKRMKHENMIADPRKKETYPYLGGDKDAEEEAAKQYRRGGPLVATAGRSLDRSPMPSTEPSFLAGKGKGLEDDSKGSRMTLPTIVLRLQKRVDADWEGTTVVVSATDQDLIQIAFHMETVDSERGVVAYMGVLAKDVDLLGQMGLRKVSQLWGMKRDFSAELAGSVEEQREAVENQSLEHTWMFFLLAPKWVRMRPTDAYYTVHPRSQGSAFRMSTAGSSVLLSLGTSVVDADAGRRKDQLGAMSTHNESAVASLRGDHAPSSAREQRLGSLSARRAPSDPGKLDLDLIAQAVSSLPAIRETRRSGPSL